MSTTPKKIRLLVFLAALMAALSGQSFSQATPKHVPKPAPTVRTPAPAAEPMPVMPPFTPTPPPFPGEGGDYERSISVDPKVNLALCVLTGTVKINGSDRSEVRVFVRDGSNIKFNVRGKNEQSGKPELLTLTGAAPENVKGKEKNKHMPVSECLWGTEIEIDVPTGAFVTVKGQEANIDLDSVRKVFVRNAGGNISLSNVREGIDASTYEGGVTVRESRGAMNLESSTGNIIAFGLAPGDVSDVLRTKTSSGNIFLQLVSHRQIEANSVSGAIIFSGKLLSGGLYGFSTSNGILTLTVPADSSAKVSASYGFGQFHSEVPLKDLTQTTAGRIKSLTAVMGGGEAVLKLTTTSGWIKIKKSYEK
jgi:hypothetical protein